MVFKIIKYIELNGLLNSDLWGYGKLHVQKFEACQYSREHNHVMSFKLRSADRSYSSVAFKHVDCTKIVTAESDSDLASAKTKNLSRFLL